MVILYSVINPDQVLHLSQWEAQSRRWTFRMLSKLDDIHDNTVPTKYSVLPRVWCTSKTSLLAQLHTCSRENKSFCSTSPITKTFHQQTDHKSHLHSHSPSHPHQTLHSSHLRPNFRAKLGRHATKHAALLHRSYPPIRNWRAQPLTYSHLLVRMWKFSSQTWGTLAVGGGRRRLAMKRPMGDQKWLR